MIHTAMMHCGDSSALASIETTAARANAHTGTKQLSREGLTFVHIKFPSLFALPW